MSSILVKMKIKIMKKVIMNKVIMNKAQIWSHLNPNSRLIKRL